MSSQTCSETFFEAKYRENADPWHFQESAYEQARYAATLECLRGLRFERAFEPGCSIGVLTEKLAALCDRVEALEISGTAAAKARERCCGLQNVEIRHGRLPDGLPGGEFDLVVFSEIGYYFTLPVLRTVVAELVERLLPGGIFLAVHWLGNSPDHELSGDQVHEVLDEAESLRLRVRERHAGFRLDRWSKA